MIDSFSGLFSTGASDDFRRSFGDRMHRNVGLQLIGKLAALLTAFGCVGAVDAVTEFRHRQDRDDDGHITGTGGSADIPEHFGRRELRAFPRSPGRWNRGLIRGWRVPWFTIDA